jgi:hypothetical protein
MDRQHVLMMRASGLLLAIIFFGGGVAVSVHDLGDPYRTFKVIPAIIGAALGLLAIQSLWSTSRFVDATQLAMAMAVVFLIGYPLRLVSDHVTWVSPVRDGLVLVGALVLTLGHGKDDRELPLVRRRKRMEARVLPRLNKRRAKRGLRPVASLDEARNERRRGRP